MIFRYLPGLCNAFGHDFQVAGVLKAAALGRYATLDDPFVSQNEDKADGVLTI